MSDVLSVCFCWTTILLTQLIDSVGSINFIHLSLLQTGKLHFFNWVHIEFSFVKYRCSAKWGISKTLEFSSTRIQANETNLWSLFIIGKNPIFIAISVTLLCYLNEYTLCFQHINCLHYIDWIEVLELAIYLVILLKMVFWPYFNFKSTILLFEELIKITFCQ